MLFNTSDEIVGYFLNLDNEAHEAYLKYGDSASLEGLTEIDTAIYTFLTGTYKISHLAGNTAKRGFLAYLLIGTKLAELVANIDPFDKVLIRSKFMIETIS